MITDRQKEILNAVVREFMKEASAVSSLSLVNRYHIGVSPATVRHEMVDLEDKGYLMKSHLSSGRIPTDLGLRYFIQELMEERPLENTDQVQVRIRVFRRRFDEEKLMRFVLNFLSDKTRCAALSIVNDTLRYRGVSSLLQFDELRDVEVLDVLLRLLESKGTLNRIFEKAGSSDVCAVIGEECEVDGLQECAVVFSGFNYYGGKKGLIGVIGPRRMPYSRVIPTVKSVSGMVESAVRGW